MTNDKRYEKSIERVESHYFQLRFIWQPRGVNFNESSQRALCTSFQQEKKTSEVEVKRLKSTLLIVVADSDSEL